MLLMLLSICGCSKTAGQTKKQKEEPVIKVGVSGIAASDSALQRVNEKLGDLSHQKYGFQIELLRDDTSAGKDFAFYTDAAEGVDIKGFYYAEFKKYAEKGMLLDMAPYLDKYGSELKRVLENKAEIECPECKNTIELDWSGDVDDEPDGCQGNCHGCSGCIDEDDDM